MIIYIVLYRIVLYCRYVCVYIRRTVKTWCRERRVSAATRGIPRPARPGRTPDPLWVFMWASSRGSSAFLARWVFCELAAHVAPLVEELGPRTRSGSPSGSSCATAGVCSRGT